MAPHGAQRVDLDEERALARARLIERLEELVEWCTRKKIYASRVGVYESLLHFDPEHSDALRGLGYKRDRNGEWAPPKKSRKPKNWDKTAAAKFPEKRATVVREYRDEMLALLEQHAKRIDEASRAVIFADILYADPDDPRVHELLGEAKVGEQWVLVETSRAKQHRPELRATLEQIFASAPKPQRGEADAREKSMGIAWAAVYETPGIRSLGTGEATEVARMTTAMFATQAYFNAILVAEGAEGGGACFPEPLTVFTLTRASDKLAFLMGHPSIDGDYRKYLMDLDGSGIQGSGDFAHWALEEPRRLDGMVRQAMAWLFAEEYGIGLEHGWLFEGFGLYMTRELVGTRLTWFVRESENLTKAQDKKLKAKLMKTESNWMNEAHKLFSSNRPTNIQFLLTKNVNQLTTEDMLYSYVLAAYLIEAQEERLPQLLGKIGAGATSEAAFAEVLGLDLPHLDERVQRWLSERR